MSTHDAVVASPVSSSIPHHLSTRSPRSSIDSSPRTPNSPFLQSLSNRFRKSSNASNFSMASDPPLQPPEPAEKIETAQEARRFVLKVVRNDWDWPPPQTPIVSGGENVTKEESKQESILSQRGPVGWRTRHEGASDLDLDISPEAPFGRKKSRRNSDPYKFESPDAIANMIQDQRYKRRRANAEEAVWNEGLRVWTERRDAWTAAEVNRPRKRPSLEGDRQARLSSPMRAHHKNSGSTSSGAGHSQEPGPVVINGNVESSSGRKSAATSTTGSNDTNEDDVLNGPYLPMYPPLFPSSHTLRSRIKPTAYPTIYSKVVVQSLTPNVPIPLTHMIGALVDGWKAEGVWPPQTLAEQQQHALLKRAKGSKKGESAFQKWRKERDAEREHQHEIFEDGFENEIVTDDDKKKSFRRSISGAVKKVLGMHPEVDEDGGLSKLGLSFGLVSDEDDGLMRESRQVTEDNILLNKALLQERM